MSTREAACCLTLAPGLQAGREGGLVNGLVSWAADRLGGSQSSRRLNAKFKCRLLMHTLGGGAHVESMPASSRLIGLPSTGARASGSARYSSRGTCTAVTGGLRARQAGQVVSTG